MDGNPNEYVGEDTIDLESYDLSALNGETQSGGDRLAKLVQVDRMADQWRSFDASMAPPASKRKKDSKRPKLSVSKDRPLNPELLNRNIIISGSRAVAAANQQQEENEDDPVFELFLEDLADEAAAANDDDDDNRTTLSIKGMTMTVDNPKFNDLNAWRQQLEQELDQLTANKKDVALRWNNWGMRSDVPQWQELEDRDRELARYEVLAGIDIPPAQAEQLHQEWKSLLETTARDVARKIQDMSLNYWNNTVEEGVDQQLTGEQVVQVLLNRHVIPVLSQEIERLRAVNLSDLPPFEEFVRDQFDALFEVFVIQPRVEQYEQWSSFNEWVVQEGRRRVQSFRIATVQRYAGPMYRRWFDENRSNYQNLLRRERPNSPDIGRDERRALVQFSTWINELIRAQQDPDVDLVRIERAPPRREFAQSYARRLFGLVIAARIKNFDAVKGTRDDAIRAALLVDDPNSLSTANLLYNVTVQQWTRVGQLGREPGVDPDQVTDLQDAMAQFASRERQTDLLDRIAPADQYQQLAILTAPLDEEALDQQLRQAMSLERENAEQLADVDAISRHLTYLRHLFAQNTITYDLEKKIREYNWVLTRISPTKQVPLVERHKTTDQRPFVLKVQVEGSTPDEVARYSYQFQWVYRPLLSSSDNQQTVKVDNFGQGINQSELIVTKEGGYAASMAGFYVCLVTATDSRSNTIVELRSEQARLIVEDWCVRCEHYFDVDPLGNERFGACTWLPHPVNRQRAEFVRKTLGAENSNSWFKVARRFLDSFDDENILNSSLGILNEQGLRHYFGYQQFVVRVMERLLTLVSVINGQSNQGRLPLDPLLLIQALVNQDPGFSDTPLIDASSDDPPDAVANRLSEISSLFERSTVYLAGQSNGGKKIATLPVDRVIKVLESPGILAVLRPDEVRFVRRMRANLDKFVDKFVYEGTSVGNYEWFFRQQTKGNDKRARQLIASMTQEQISSYGSANDPNFFVDVQSLKKFKDQQKRAKRRRDDDQGTIVFGIPLEVWSNQIIDSTHTEPQNGRWIGRHSTVDRQPTPYMVSYDNDETQCSIESRGSERINIGYDLHSVHKRIKLLCDQFNSMSANPPLQLQIKQKIDRAVYTFNMIAQLAPARQDNKLLTADELDTVVQHF